LYLTTLQCRPNSNGNGKCERHYRLITSSSF